MTPALQTLRPEDGAFMLTWTSSQNRQNGERGSGLWSALAQHREPWALPPKPGMVQAEAGQSGVRGILGYIRSWRPAWAL